MVRCPDGHESASEDYCDVCGMRIGAVQATVPSASVSASPGPVSVPDAGGPDGCPQCGTARSGAFCESCGYNFATATPVGPTATPAPAVTPAAPAAEARGVRGVAPPDSASWTAVVAADRAYYEKVESQAGPGGSGIEFPGYCPERRFELTGTEMRIGRRSPSRGLNPEIDLTGPPTDPGISRLHAVLMATADGWAVVDPGSANGTQLNGSDIPTGEQVPLHDGDQITLGAWTKVTLRAP